MSGRSASSSSARTCSTTRICPSQSGWLASTTWSSTSAPRTSSRVARKLATRWCGSLRMKPTVSVTRARCPSPRSTSRVRVSSVAKSRSSTTISCCAGERPQDAGLAGVGVADQRHAQHRIAAGAEILPVPLHVLQLGLEALDLLPDDPAVGFELGFARARAGRCRRGYAKGGSTCGSAGAADTRAAPARPAAWPRGCAPGSRRCRG